MLSLAPILVSLAFSPWVLGMWLVLMAVPLILVECPLVFSQSNLFFSLGGVSSLSYNLILMTLWLTPMMMSASWSIYYEENSSTMFKLCLMSLSGAVVGFFFSGELSFFFFFFEISLVPIFAIVLGWGYQPERIMAGTYLLVYTISSSLPLLMGICYESLSWSNFNIIISSVEGFSFSSLSSMSSSFVFLAWSLAFMVKLPVYGLHMWLPKAHVQAPIGGSMVLAGVLLKLGGYGLIVVSSFIWFSSYFLSWMISMIVVGSVWACLVCMVQIDYKSLIAYSSVAHMGLTAVAIYSMSESGWSGAELMMVGHGLSSPGMFVIAAMMTEISGSRSLLVTKGLLNLFPLLTLLCALVCFCNIGSPITLNLMAEIKILSSLAGFSWPVLGCGLLCSFLGAVFSLILYLSTQHGFNSLVQNPSGVSIYLVLPMLMLLIPVNLLFLTCLM